MASAKTPRFGGEFFCLLGSFEHKDFRETTLIDKPFMYEIVFFPLAASIQS